MNKRAIRACAATLAATLLSAAAPSIAHANIIVHRVQVGAAFKDADSARPYSPEPPPGMTRKQIAHEAAVGDAVDSIRNQANASGLNAVYPDEQSGRLIVRWQAPPLAVRNLDGKVMAGLTVDVHAVKYSAEDLLAAGEQLLKASQKGGVPGVISVTGSDDGQGLKVAVGRTTVQGLGRAGLSAGYSKVARMRADVVVGNRIEPTSRQNDSIPWYGGGLIRNPGFNPPYDLDPYDFCSVAFAVLTSSGYGRLLSARHCDPTGNLPYDDGAGDPFTYGYSQVSVKTVDDTMLMDPIGGTGGWVHGGPWNATRTNSRYHLKVAGARSAVYNTTVCTSGANSGEHCGLKVLDRYKTQWNCGTAVCRGYSANLGYGAASTVGGDSGGPVYALQSDGRVVAVGVIYGGAIDVSCGNVRFPVGNCLQTAVFIDMPTLLASWNVRIETTP